MNAVLDRLVNTKSIPTRGDLNDLMAAVGEPGEKQDEKRAAVEDLFRQLGKSMTNFQKFSVIDDLNTYEAY